MADNSQQQNIVLKIGVEGQQDVAAAQQQVATLTNTAQQAGKVDLATPVKTLKQELRGAIADLQRLAAAGKDNTKEYTDAAKKVAELKDKIEETNQTVKAFDPDNKFRVLANAAGVGAKAVQGYAGAMAFLGDKSEATTETIAKLQGIMAFADAINSINDLKDTWRDLGRLLGITTTATKAQTTAVAENTTVTEENATVTEANATATEAQATATEAQAVASEATTTATQAQTTAVAENTVATEANATVTEANATATEAQAVASEATAGAMEAQTVATEGATVASITLGTALKAIGIGLIIAAVAYLISNWDDLKASVEKLFPGLSQTGEMFGKLKEIFMGVGSVVVNFLLQPVKAFIQLLQGDLSGAGNSFLKTFNLIGNYQKGAADERAKQADTARREQLEKTIKHNELLIAEQQKLGKDTTALEVQNWKDKIAALDKNSKDYKDKVDEYNSKIIQVQNAHTKKLADAADKAQKEKEQKQKEAHQKYLAKLEADLKEIQKQTEDAQKVLRDVNENQRVAELADIQAKYTKELLLLDKHKSDMKGGLTAYNAARNTLVEAQKAEEAKINKKYDDQIKEFDNQLAEAGLSEFQKKAKEINKQADELLKNATTQGQKDEINNTRNGLLANNTALESATHNNAVAATDLTKTEDENRPNEKDTPDEAKAKIEAVSQAKFDAEQAAFELKKTQAQGNADQLAQIEADHQKNVNDITQEGSEARKKIEEAEKDARLDTMSKVAEGLGNLAQLAGEQTVAGKALGVAQATIDTYVGATKALAQGGIFGFIGAAAVITAGLLNVKKILSTKVPAATGSSTGSSSGSSSTAPPAPVINSTVLQQAQTGTSDIVNAVNNSKTQQNLRAYITQKDIDKNQQSQDFYKQQSTY